MLLPFPALPQTLLKPGGLKRIGEYTDRKFCKLVNTFSIRPPVLCIFTQPFKQ